MYTIELADIEVLESDGESETQALLTINVSASGIADVSILAFINWYAGELGLGLFHGAGGDFSLLAELKLQPVEIQNSILQIASSEAVDISDDEAIQEFLLDIENKVVRLVPQTIWKQLRGETRGRPPVSHEKKKCKLELNCRVG